LSRISFSVCWLACSALSAALTGAFERVASEAAALVAATAATAVAAIAAAEADIVAHVNADHADALAAIGHGLLGGPAGEWRLVAVDPDGADLALEERVLRLNFSSPATGPDDIRAELIRAAREANTGYS
jgi:putative heme iron utilization protein